MEEVEEKEVEKVLKKGKKPLFKILKFSNTRKHYLLFYLMIIVILGIIIYIKIINKPINNFALLLSIIFCILIFLGTETHRLYNSYEINQNSLVHTVGYLTKKSKRMDFSSISDFYIIQDIWQRMLSYGNIDVRLYSGETTMNIRNINHPKHIIDIIEKRMRMNERSYAR